MCHAHNMTHLSTPIFGIHRSPSRCTKNRACGTSPDCSLLFANSRCRSSTAAFAAVAPCMSAALIASVNLVHNLLKSAIAIPSRVRGDVIGRGSDKVVYQTECAEVKRQRRSGRGKNRAAVSRRRRKEGAEVLSDEPWGTRAGMLKGGRTHLLDSFSSWSASGRTVFGTTLARAGSKMTLFLPVFLS